MMEHTAGTVHIQGLRLFGRHGVMPQERTVGNEFEIDAKLSFDATQAMASDCLEATLNYASVVEAIKEQMAEPSMLLENVLWRIAQTLAARFGMIDEMELAIYKIHPPIPVQMGRVGFSCTWHKGSGLDGSAPIQKK